ncbi:maleylpyruvate isomerase family mycothiol-dependent enzyme [Mycobacterium sp. 663a-19]|uniref:maleylpyruvate isomerase family mycothiol-dependent enzyme n=1 Tax=Mycobacterium sp. 663a-19 TaxID=2986148 RepID=UPI002D1EE306|nr:maleylpyruvate isomerase family mycothiol-dependent enzyme [Mycobacterium sp. 663a-19]MEB3980979.1 maleylpyruvate isomerase family mycothiol-dependent enzyme [Mycobacterium sp. 663a-19]
MISKKACVANESNHPVAGPDKTRVLAELPAAMEQFCGLLLHGDDLNVDGIGHWSASDVAAHVATVLELNVGLARGRVVPVAAVEAIPDWTQAALETVEDRRPQALADRIQAAVTQLADAASSRDGDPRVAWHAGLSIPISTVLALMVGEAMIHGCDIARALGRRWHIPSPWADTTFRGMVQVVPLYFLPERSAGVHARLEMRLRGSETRALFSIADGRLQIAGPNGERADCYISGEPGALLLLLYGRTGQLRPTVTGRVVAWGRRPWLAIRFPHMFRNP